MAKKRGGVPRASRIQRGALSLHIPHDLAYTAHITHAKQTIRGGGPFSSSAAQFSAFREPPGHTGAHTITDCSIVPFEFASDTRPATFHATITRRERRIRVSQPDHAAPPDDWARSTKSFFRWATYS